MGISTSIFLLAVGAVLAFAVEVQTEGFDLNAIGVILMVVGAIGILVSMLFWSSWGGFGRDYGRRGGDVIVERGPVRRRVIEEDI